MNYIGTCYGIDPGKEQSAYVQIENERPVKFEIVRNYDLLSLVDDKWQRGARVVIENYVPFSRLNYDIRDTIIWIGRFQQAFFREFEVTFLQRDQIKKHLLGRTTGSDADIKAAMVKRFGEPGRKDSKGLLYGMKSHQWQALAAVVTWLEMWKQEQAGLETVNDFVVSTL